MAKMNKWKWQQKKTIDTISKTLNKNNNAFENKNNYTSAFNFFSGLNTSMVSLYFVLSSWWLSKWLQEELKMFWLSCIWRTLGTLFESPSERVNEFTIFLPRLKSTVHHGHTVSYENQVLRTNFSDRFERQIVYTVSLCLLKRLKK